MGQSDALKKVVQDAIDSPVEFKPNWYHEPAGNCIFVTLEDVAMNAVWINHHVTVYHALDDGRVVGMQLCGVAQEMGKPNA